MGKQERDLEGLRNGAQKDLADLSAIDILVASLKLMRNHTKLFLLIVVWMLLPVVVIENGFFWLARWLASVIQNPPAGVSVMTGGPLRMTSGTFETSISQYNSGVSDFPYSILVNFGVDMASTLLGNMLVPVYFCPIVYAVACIFTNTSVTFSDTVAAMRTCWSRTCLTALCVSTIHIASSLFMLANNSYYRGRAIKPNSALPEEMIVSASVWLLVSLATIIATFMFELSLHLATLEDKLGWKAMGKAWWLLRSKLRVALGVNVLLFPMTLPVTAVVLWTVRTIPSPQAWVLLALCLNLWETVYFTIQIVMTSVLYLSCKAKRGDSLEEVRPFRIDLMEKLYTKVATLESEAK